MTIYPIETMKLKAKPNHFGSDPKHDIELMRAMRNAQLKREQRREVAAHLGLYLGSALLMGMILRKIYHLFHH